MRQSLIAVALGAVLAAILTYPTIVRPGSVARVDSDDGKFSVWNVAWVAHALLTDPRHVFDANIFSPHRTTLAYSEANLLEGVIGIVPYWLSENPWLTLNLVMLAGFASAYAGAWLLLRHVCGDRGAAAGGVVVGAEGFTGGDGVTGPGGVVVV